MATQTDAVRLNDLDRGTDNDEDLLWALMDVDGVNHGHVSVAGTPTVFPEDNDVPADVVRVAENHGYEVKVIMLPKSDQTAVRLYE